MNGKDLATYNWQLTINPSISLCMIAKNEEKRLARCIESVKNLVSEIIIIDTGSTDDTEKIARSLGCKVYHMDWNDDFAEVRNYSISKASGDWILIMDPDETISEKDHYKIRQYTKHPHIKAYQLPTRNYGNGTREHGAVICKGEYEEEKEYKCYISSIKTRLFKNGLGIHFTGCYHELVDHYIHKKKIPGLLVKTPIHHWVHEICQNNIEEKRQFYLMLGEKKISQQPNDAQAWFELATSEAICGLRNRAAASLKKAISLGFRTTKAYFMLARLSALLNQPKIRLLSYEKGLCKLFPALTHINPDLKSDAYLL